jgi:hypothetical protein
VAEVETCLQLTMSPESIKMWRSYSAFRDALESRGISSKNKCYCYIKGDMVVLDYHQEKGCTTFTATLDELINNPVGVADSFTLQHTFC